LPQTQLLGRRQLAFLPAGDGRTFVSWDQVDEVLLFSGGMDSFAGAAEELKEALLVNPYDIDEVAEALEVAITMPLKERQERNNALLERIRRHDARYWQENFLSALEQTSLGAAA